MQTSFSRSLLQPASTRSKTIIRSSWRNLVVACAVLGPAELSSQAWRSSWLDYNGTIDGTYTATCETSVGVVPRAGKLRFNFYLSGNDAKTKFVQASGAIKPEPGDQFGCTGTWSAGAAAGPGTDKAVCAEHLARMERFWSGTALPFERQNRTVYSDRNLERDLLQLTSRKIQGIKSLTQPGSLEEQEEIRRKTYARINQLTAVVKQIEAHADEMRRMWSEARAAGCSLPSVPTRTGADKAIDELLELDAPKNPPAIPSVETIGVVLIQGQVEEESATRKGLLTSSTKITLDKPTTIRTGPGSSVTINVGSVIKTLQPNTTIRIVPSRNGQPDIIQQGAATVDVRKPGAYQIQTPTATVNVDGTVFTVSYDATTGVTGVTVEEGRVMVRSKNPGEPALRVTSGEYVEVTRQAMSAVLAAPGAPGRVAAHPQVSKPETPPNIHDIPAKDAGRYLNVRLNGRVAILDWSNSPTSSGSWVSIVPVGTSDGAHAGRWEYTQNKSSGRYENGPLDLGPYEARFYSNRGYDQLVDRVRFDVVAQKLTGRQEGPILRVQVDGRPYAIVTWSNAPTPEGAWVSVVPVRTAVSTHVGKWTFTNQTASGRYEAGPLVAGNYEARFYGDGGYGKLVERVRFKVR